MFDNSPADLMADVQSQFDWSWCEPSQVSRVQKEIVATFSDIIGHSECVLSDAVAIALSDGLDEADGKPSFYLHGSFDDIPDAHYPLAIRRGTEVPASYCI